MSFLAFAASIGMGYKICSPLYFISRLYLNIIHNLFFISFPLRISFEDSEDIYIERQTDEKTKFKP